ncbi:KH DOMAIN CONTAINING RNA BINDING PROTEIN [Salix viminalis]|uniref:KH DOMAIN CONTAINING RNA BINDING PROTEIN n=1 Tax=Salix viminalis TaxID=40686 RepID=A0A9Q0TB35_SALVM|nr:KH DOMAIN CONTAINING RNA BINDING PROTEIN [Salix viminalis]
MDGNRWRFFKKPVNTQFKRKGARISCRKGKYEELSENYLDDDTVYRTLCPSKKTGGVIGKGGKVVKALREETQSKITVADSVLVHDWIVEDDGNEINAVTARLLVQQGKKNNCKVEEPLCSAYGLAKVFGCALWRPLASCLVLDNENT